MPNEKQDDIQALHQLNIMIGEAEAKGDDHSREWLKAHILPELAFQRADGMIVNRETYLKGIKPYPRVTEVESIAFYRKRAVVSCIVTGKLEGGDKRYHNLRLFVQVGGQWKLLGWANEQV